MKISHKLGLNVLVTVALLTVGGVGAGRLVRDATRHTESLTDVAEPLKEALLVMEVNAVETAQAVLAYVVDPAERARVKMVDSQEDFARAADVFARLAESEGEQSFGTRSTQLYGALAALGEGIVTMVDRREVSPRDAALADSLQAALTTFADGLEELDRFMDGEGRPLVQGRIDLAVAAAQRSGSLARRFINVAGALVLLVVGVMSWVVFREVARATRRLSEGAREFGRGNLAHRVEVRSMDELGDVARAFNAMAEQRGESEARLRERTDELLESQRVGGLGTYTFDAATGTWSSSEVLDRIFGIAGTGYERNVAGWIEIVHPAHREEMEEYLRSHVLALKRGFDREYRIVRVDDGEECWVHGLGELALDEHGDVVRMVGTIQDITDRKRAEGALRRSEEEYRGLVNHAVHGIYRSTPAEGFTSANPAIVRMLGYDSEDELLALDLERELYADPAERRRVMELVDNRRRIHGVETVWKRADGSHIDVRLNGRVLRGEGEEVEAYEMIVEDVTDRRLLEEQLRQAQKMEAIGQLTGGVAHDFNNILSVIHLNTELMARAMETGERLDATALGAIEAATTRARGIVRQLLGFGRRAQLSSSPTDLAALVRNLLPMLKALLPEDIGITVGGSDDVRTVRVDPRSVDQMLLNLATNSRDAMWEGGELSIDVHDVDYDEEYCAEHPYVTPGGYVRISVTDTGVGMDEDARARAFEPFFTTKEIGSGTGLGLPMVYGLAKQQGGHIDLSSEPGQGTTISISFPAVEVEADVEQPRSRVGRGEHVGDGETILLVEDDETLRSTGKRVLTSGGYIVLVADDGAAALDVFRAHEGTIDLVISDLVMPNMGGADLYQALALAGDAPRFILTSGYSGQEAGKLGDLPDSVAFLEKPWSIEDLMELVSDVLGEGDGTGS